MTKTATRYNTTKKCACGCSTSVELVRLGSVAFEPGDAPGIVRGTAEAFVDADGRVFARGPIGAVVIACRGCGAPRYAEPVRGTFVAEKRCDSRCHAATGHKCDCSCGGKNHGAAHSAVRAIKAAA